MDGRGRQIDGGPPIVDAGQPDAGGACTLPPMAWPPDIAGQQLLSQGLRVEDKPEHGVVVEAQKRG